MLKSKKALLAAGMIAGAVAMTGCSAGVRTAATPVPQMPKVTAQPAQVQQEDGASEESAQQNSEEKEAQSMLEDTPLTLKADGKKIEEGAIREEGKLLVPLSETAQALGWKAESEQTTGETESRRVVTLTKDESRITVSWTVSDNTARSITWQKDGLLIPVDTKITTMDSVVYVPAAFFEAAMDAVVNETKDGISIQISTPENTPETEAQELEGNG